jgi:hypothetical protein
MPSFDVTLNGTDKNPYAGFELSRNPFPLPGVPAEFAEPLRILESEPIPTRGTPTTSATSSSDSRRSSS